MNTNKIWIEKMKPFGVFSNVTLIYETEILNIYYNVTDEIDLAGELRLEILRLRSQTITCVFSWQN